MDVIAYVCIETNRSKVRTAQQHRLVKDCVLIAVLLLSGHQSCNKPCTQASSLLMIPNKQKSPCSDGTCGDWCKGDADFDLDIVAVRAVDAREL